MVLKIKEDSIDANELKQDLSRKFENYYSVSNRGKFGLVLAKSKSIGVVITLRKNKIYIVGNFPELWVSLLFMLSIVVFAIIPPLVFYYIFFHKKMKWEEKKVTTYLKEAYAHKIVD